MTPTTPAAETDGVNELIASALPWLPAALGPFLLLLAVPLLGRRGRVTTAMVFVFVIIMSIFFLLVDGVVSLTVGAILGLGG